LICIIVKRGFDSVHLKTLNKSLGLIYLFLEHCKIKLQCSRFFFNKNLIQIIPLQLNF
jgi:hypothetical protein